MNLNVGIVGGNKLGWQTLLEQEGVPYMFPKQDPAANIHSVVVVADTHDDVDQIKKYLAEGGAVLCSGKFFSKISGVRAKRRFVKYLLGDKDSEYAGLGMIDVYCDLNLPANGNAVLTDNCEFAVLMEPYLGGVVVVLPFDAGELVLDTRVKRKSFYSQQARLPFELVSCVSKGKILKLVSRSLMVLHHWRGLTYIHKWYYPQSQPTIFSWRIDTDYATQEQIEALYEIIRLQKIRASWFVDVKSQESFLPVYESMAEQEIGIHCYEHKTYDDYLRNSGNIRKALDRFSLTGLKGRSFAAPYGRWSEGLAKAIDEADFEFSSEFSYDYDSIPSFPVLNGHLSVLQIPIHPVSIGSLRRQGYNQEMMCNYFESVIEDKFRHREPLVFYYHPKDGNHEVVRFILELLKKKQIENFRMIDYARWWKARDAIRFQVNVEKDNVYMTGSIQSPSHYLHIVSPDGTEAFSPMQSSIDLQSLKWVRQLPVATPPSDIGRVRKFNYRIPLTLTEDYLFKLFNKERQ